jgi:hypothetical protein
MIPENVWTALWSAAARRRFPSQAAIVHSIHFGSLVRSLRSKPNEKESGVVPPHTKDASRHLHCVGADWVGLGRVDGI